MRFAPGGSLDYNSTVSVRLIVQRRQERTVGRAIDIVRSKELLKLRSDHGENVT